MTEPRIVTKHIDRVVGKSHFVGTITYVEDLERQAKVEQMVADFIAHNIVTGKYDHLLRKTQDGSGVR